MTGRTHGSERAAAEGIAATGDIRRPESRNIIPIEQAPSMRGFTSADDRARHDNPHWPVRSPEDAASALQLHGDCPLSCSTRVAALRVSADDYQYFRERGRIER
ncbi:hypothetical protein IU449_09555 [Nocardia higoensis]|uniref:Uncharacterized protein n=1 Tax=Nocardia higoensis TaxID=228599 RepID=A0ABS0D8I8_9NOCA|nr:hypothetical protein [Nocardia higoensis]MBF6354786.1 hypothetical protein [Nocardia higoensis]